MNRGLLLITIASLITTCILAFKRNNNEEDSARIQTGVVVSDLEKSYDFYTKVVGMTKAGTFHVDPDIATDAGLTDHKAIDIIDLKLPGEPGSPEYKITKIHDEKGAVSKSFQPGHRYITIFVNNLRPYYQRLKEHKVPLWNEKRINFSNEFGVLIFSDPDGAMIEIQGPAIN